MNVEKIRFVTFRLSKKIIKNWSHMEVQKDQVWVTFDCNVNVA